MKISLNRKIGYVEVDSNYFITLHSLAEILQEVTIQHYQEVGEPPPKLNEKSVWIIYQFGIEIFKWAIYEEEIEIRTWHRGIRDYKAYREFEVYSNQERQL